LGQDPKILGRLLKFPGFFNSLLGVEIPRLALSLINKQQSRPFWPASTFCAIHLTLSKDIRIFWAGEATFINIAARGPIIANLYLLGLVGFINSRFVLRVNLNIFFAHTTINFFHMQLPPYDLFRQKATQPFL
jgi:hypothetical protein